MEILQNIFENKITWPTFLERKIHIEDKFTLLYGPKASGKTYLIYDYLSTLEEDSYLYIDMNDLKVSSNFHNKLNEFLILNKITTLAIDNYDYTFELPVVSSILLCVNNFKFVDSFTHLYVGALGFEEYLLFDTKHQNTTNSFNSFLKYGNLPEIINYKDFDKSKRNQEILLLNDNNKTSLEILKLLVISSGELKSPYWLYTILKKDIKISKDFFYNKIKEYEENATIIFCKKFEHPRAVKKIFIYNHGLIDSITYNKKFINVFSSMIFLELYSKIDKVYYLEGADFYIPNKNAIIICMPFFNNISLGAISNKLLKSISTLQIDTITIVTVSNYDNIFIDEIPCDVLPFYEWALSD